MARLSLLLSRNVIKSQFEDNPYYYFCIEILLENVNNVYRKLIQYIFWSITKLHFF